MSKMNKKLDKILAEITEMSLKITKIERNMLIFETKLLKVETKLIDQRKEIKAKLKTKATSNNFNDLHYKILELERKLEANKNENLQKESYSKPMNLLMHELRETNAWETKKQTSVILENFIKEGLLLNPKLISL